MTPTVRYAFSIPVRTPSLTNLREFWRHRHKRVLVERHATAAMCARAGVKALATWEAAAVHLTRLSPGTLDSDNLPPSMKSIRDELAKRFGLDDADPRVVWTYAQEKTRAYRRGTIKPRGATETYGVRVEITIYSQGSGAA